MSDHQTHDSAEAHQGDHHEQVGHLVPMHLLAARSPS